MSGREEDLGPNPLGPNMSPPPLQMPPPPAVSQAAQNNFYASLLQGLDPSIAATIENQLPPMWGTFPQDPNLADVPPINLGGFSNWGAFAGNPDFIAPGGGENFVGPYDGISGQNLLSPVMSNGQPTSVSESGYFNSFSMSSDGVQNSGLGFGVEDGQQLYAEAMSQWRQQQQQQQQQQAPLQGAAPNTRSYDLFGPPTPSSDVFHAEPESGGQAGGVSPLGSPTPPPPQSAPTSSVIIAPAPASSPSTPPAAAPSTNAKPSYSEVTKNKPPPGKSKSKARSRTNSAHSLKDEHISIVASNHSNSSKGSSQRKGRNNLSGLNRNKSVPLEPTTIQPNSRYGLDTFDEPPSGGGGGGGGAGQKNHSGGKGGDLCSKSSQSSDSLPQSRKGSTSSVGSSVSAIDEITLNNKVHAADDVEEEEKSQEISHQKAVTTAEEPVVAAVVAEKPQLEPLKIINSAQPPPAKLKEAAFFDPKRIFAKQEKDSNAPLPPSKPQPPQPQQQQQHQQQLLQKDYVPNNQQAKRPSPDPLLNNGKPKSNLTSSINRSCYINNDLRDQSSRGKQTNAAKSGHSGGGHTGGGGGSSSHKNSRGGGCGGGGGDGGGEETQAPPPAPATTTTTSSVQGGGKAQPGGAARRRPVPGPQERKRKDEGPPGKKRSKRDGDSTAGGTHILGKWMQKCWEWTAWSCQELFFILWNITKLVLSLGLLMMLLFGQYFMLVCKKSWAFVTTHVPLLNRGGARGQDEGAGGKGRPAGLKENIQLPTTGEEAMKRLLACRGKDPYSILGLKVDAPDDEIKKYYRKQAVLVHPDKNQQPGAEEAFKILGHAFELIGDPSKRGTYDAKRCENDQAETAMHEFADLLTKLHDKLQEAANLMRCENCGGKHRRVPTDRPIYAARFCDRCNIRHPSKEGDVWAESRVLGFLWHYYACMDSKVYDITEWASCQSEHFKRIQANAHHVIYRISTNSSRQRQNSSRSNEADLDDFLSHLFHQSGPKPGAGPAGDADPYAGTSQGPHAKWAGPQGGGAAPATGAAKKAKCRRKKGRH